MTSMPASWRAAAITFAPRSWPSSPGLATSTRIFRSIKRFSRQFFPGSSARKFAVCSMCRGDGRRYPRKGADCNDDPASPGVASTRSAPAPSFHARRRDTSTPDPPEPGGLRHHRGRDARRLGACRLLRARALSHHPVLHATALDDGPPDSQVGRGPRPRARHPLPSGTMAGGLLATPVVELGRTEAQLDLLFAEQVEALEVTLSDLLVRFGLQSPLLDADELVSPSWLLGLMRELVENLGFHPRQRVPDHPHDGLHAAGALELPHQGAGRVRRGRCDGGTENWEKVGTAVRRYVVLKTIVSLGTGLCIGGLMALLGVNYPILWGVLAFCSTTCPTSGPSSLPCRPCWFAWHTVGAGTAVAAAAGFLVVNVLWGNLIEPRVMGYSVGLSTLVVFASLVFWGWVLGPVGMLPLGAADGDVPHRAGDERVDPLDRRHARLGEVGRDHLGHRVRGRAGAGKIGRGADA